jgi:hypothetical protein
MLTLGSLALLLVEGPHALFQRKKALVDLSALLLPLLIVALAILGSLAPGKVD